MNYIKISLKISLFIFYTVLPAMERPKRLESPHAQTSLIVLNTDLGNINVNFDINNNKQSLVIDEISSYDLVSLTTKKSFPVKNGIHSTSNLDTKDNVHYGTFNLHPEHETIKGFVLKIKASPSSRELLAALYQKKDSSLNLIKEVTLHLNAQNNTKSKENSIAFLNLTFKNEPLEFDNIIFSNSPIAKKPQKNSWKLWKK